jgi:hypothetical protein
MLRAQVEALSAITTDHSQPRPVRAGAGAGDLNQRRAGKTSLAQTMIIFRVDGLLHIITRAVHQFRAAGQAAGDRVAGP